MKPTSSSTSFRHKAPWRSSALFLAAGAAFLWWAFQGTIRISIADGHLRITRADWSWETPKELANIPVTSIQIVEFRQGAYLHTGKSLHSDDGFFLHCNHDAVTSTGGPILKYTATGTAIHDPSAIEIPVPGSGITVADRGWNAEDFRDRLLAGIRANAFEDRWTTHRDMGIALSVICLVVAGVLWLHHFSELRRPSRALPNWPKPLDSSSR